MEMLMKLDRYIIVTLLCLSFNVYAVESDESRFLAKEKENTLKILDYKATMEARKKAEDEAKRKEQLEKLRTQNELEYKRKLRLSKEEEERLKHEEEVLREAQRKAEIERLKEEQRQKLLAKKQAEEEERRRRVSKYKLVLAGEKDRINLKGNIQDSFYMEDYSELGTPEDITSSLVARDNLATTDMYVRLLIETNINSRRAGEFVAISEKDVFSFDSKGILIPKGSKFICTFEPLEAYGETALISECKRIYFPNGKSMLITSSILSDTMGRAGIIGELDNRMWEKYGQTFSLSVLSGLAMMGADKLPTTGVTSLAQYTALNVLDLSTKFLEKTIDLAPVVTIPSGTRVILKLQVDVNLQPVDSN
jgi:type IV secretory pathway VirB10-like protein